MLLDPASHFENRWAKRRQNSLTVFLTKSISDGKRKFLKDHGDPGAGRWLPGGRGTQGQIVS